MFIPLDNGKKAITEVMFDAETARQGVDSAIKYHNQHPELTVCASYHAVTLASTPDILFILRCKMPVEVFHICCMGTYCTFSDTSWTCTVHVQTGLYDLFFCMWWGVNYSIRYLQHDSVWFLHADIFKVQPQNMLVVLWFCACTRTLGRRHLHAVCCTVLASESFIMPCTHTQTHTIRHFTLFYLCINSCEQPKPHLIVSQHQISGVSTCCFFQFVFHLSIRKLKPNFLSERTVIVREIQLSSSLNN